MATKAQNNETRKVNKLRYAEYYGQQPILDGLYADSKDGRIFKNLMPLILSQKLISVIRAILTAPIRMPDGSLIHPQKGTPQGGILSPLLANIVLNELDHWIDGQWLENPVTESYSSHVSKSGGPNKGNAYRAMKKTNLKEMRIIRYADDVRILCRTRNQANRAAEAVKLWLNERLCLQVSEEKTRVVNVKKHYTEFLGFKLRTERKKGKLVVQSHICDKAKGKIATMAKEQVKRIQRPVNSGEQVKEICKYNAMVRGWHNYYEIATQVSCDFAEITWQVSRAVQNRLKLVISKSGSMGKKSKDYEKYGKAQFKKRGIESVEDLLRCYPKEYRDYRVPVSVRTLKDRQDERAAVLGIVTGCRILQGKHAMVRLKDKDGGNISAVWFNQAFRVRQVVLGGSYIVGGMARWDDSVRAGKHHVPAQNRAVLLPQG